MLGENTKKSKIVQFEYIYFFVMTIIIMFISYQLYTLQDRLSKSLIQVVYNQTQAILSNIVKKTKSYNDLDDYLPIMVSGDIKRVFVLLYHDKLFYSLENLPKSHMHMPMLFMIEDEEKTIILKAINTNYPQIKFHNNIYSVGFSLYYPVNLYYKDKKYPGVIVVDYKLSTLKNLANTIKYIRLSIVFVDGISVILLIFAGMLFIRTRHYKISSYIDTLTGIPNRKILKEIKKKFREDMVVAMLDVDFFKKINDTYGHDVGDMVLKEVANTIKNSIREDDIVIRYGGEEFLIILNCINPIKCIKTLERIRMRVEALELKIEGKTINTSVSIGVCTKCIDLEDCIKKADIALYRAKNNGRNRVEICDEKDK